MAKIAIGGPPHSGKSVLVSLLTGLIPREKFVVVEAAPDGEGITGWSHSGDAELVRAVRHKGMFSKTHVNWVVESLRRSTMPITLVDLGGMLLDEDGNFTPTGVRFTPENERILRECDYLLVIANPNYAEAARRWSQLAEELGVKTLATLESVLSGADDEVWGGEPLRARITKLERENPPDSATARAVAEHILQLAGDECVQDGSEVADVNFPRLAEELELPRKNGGPDRDFAPTALRRIVETVVEWTAGQADVRLWGNTPLGAPYHALACNLAQDVWYADPKLPGGYICLPELGVHGTGSDHLSWTAQVRGDHTLVEFVIPEQVFDAKDLPEVVVPEVDARKGVIISGKAPRWLTGAIARAYHRAGVAWVSCFEPRESSRLQAGGETWSEANPNCGPAVVVGSHSETHSVGAVTPFLLLSAK